MKNQILIIDLGSQYTEIIRRSLRYLGFHSIILPPEKSLEWTNNNRPKSIILSGGSASVYDKNSPQIPRELLALDIPILGICYGMQWLAYIHDNKSVVNQEVGKSYGPVEVEFTKTKQDLFVDLPNKIKVWASHGDSVQYTPPEFNVTAVSHKGNVIEAIESPVKKLYGVQFHPEVEETEDQNFILRNFVEGICKCEKDYSVQDVITEIQRKTKEEIGDGIAMIGVSGGVDSTTLAMLLSPVLGSKLKAFIIDTGGLRKGELNRVIRVCQNAGIHLEVIDEYKDKFIQAISTTIDSEEKRARFREVYKEVFNMVAQKFKATYILQGTLATDIIESGKSGKSALIKTHHNVGLKFNLKEVTPFSDLFKFEVRNIAETLGLDKEIAQQRPFPGPGLYIRIVGIPISHELIEIVREADDIVNQILLEYKNYSKISQVVVGLMGTKTVGVKGDGRVNGYALVVRTVETRDFMTTKGHYLPQKVCEKIISALTKHPKIVRVWFDMTPKPPATTEFE